MLNSPKGRSSTQWWFLLLLAPFIGVLWVPFFNYTSPEIWGIPFFFWYQFLWVVISALVTALVYFKTTPQPKEVRQKINDRIAGDAL